MDFSFSDLNFNSVETLPGFEVRAALSNFPPASAVRFATAASSRSMTSKYSFEIAHNPNIITNFVL